MTDDSNLATLLRTSTVSADPPPVDRLRGVVAARRRRRRAVAVAAVVVPLLAAAGVVAAWPGADPERVEAIDGPIPTTATSAAVDPTTTMAPTTTSASEPVQETELSPPILVPTGDWELRHLDSTNLAYPSDVVTLMTDAGDLGPMAVVRFNVDVDTLDYADGPPTHRDTTSPEGRTVRIGHGDDPDRRTAIFLVDGGSVAITAFDIEEPQVLALSDAVEVVGGELMVASASLPGGLRIQSPTFDGPALTTSYSLLQDTTTVAIRANRRRGDIQDLWEIRYRPDVVETTIGGRRTLLSVGDNGPLGETLAVVLTEDWVYTVGMPPWAADTPPATIEEIEAVVASLEPIDEAELLTRLPDLQDRREVLGRWFADADPATATSLAWVLDGPPMGLGEANYYQQLLSCAAVLDWAGSGDPAILDHLATNADWAVSRDLARFWADVAADREDGGEEFLSIFREQIVDEADLVGARAATTETERRDLSLVQDCGWAAELLD